MDYKENQASILLVDQIGKKIWKVKNHEGTFIKKSYFQHDNIDVFYKLKQTGHPNVCEVLDIIEHEDHFDVLEPYLGELTLLNWTPIQNEEAFVNIMLQIFDGVGFLHSQKIVHRDLKPENIYLVNGRVVITDFDISKENVHKPHQRRDTTVLGSVGYASPEQYGFMRSDARSDIYSLGVLMNVLLTGKFVSDKLSDSKFQEVILKCIELNPNDRYQSIEALRDAFLQNRKMNSKYTLPGYRTKQKWKMLLAPFLYLLMLGMIIMVESEGSTTFFEDLDTKIMMATFLVPSFLVVTNYRSIREISPRILRKSKVLSSIFVWMELFVIGIIIFLVFGSIF